MSGWLDATGRRPLGSIPHEIPLEKMAGAGDSACGGRLSDLSIPGHLESGELQRRKFMVHDQGNSLGAAQSRAGAHLCLLCCALPALASAAEQPWPFEVL